MPLARIKDPDTLQSRNLEVTLGGFTIDPDILRPVRLELNALGVPSLLFVKLYRSFDDLSDMTLGSTAIEVSYRPFKEKSNRKRKKKMILFRGTLVTQAPSFEAGRDEVLLIIPDITWDINSEIVEMDIHKASPAWVINNIWNGELLVRESFEIPDLEDDYDFKNEADLSILGGQYRNYNLLGRPAFDAIGDVIRSSGNFLHWVEYEKNKTTLQVKKRKTGVARTLTLGAGSGTDLRTNVLSINGQKSAMALTNMVVGRGGRIIKETTNEGPQGGTLEFRQDWDSTLNADILAEPGIVFSDGKYDAVGRRYVMEAQGDFDYAGAVFSLVEAAEETRSKFGYRERSKRVQLFYREGSSDTFRPYPGRVYIDRLPPGSSRALVSGVRLNREGGLALYFDAPQVYATSDTSGYVGFRDFRLTFSARAITTDHTKNLGRVTARSGKVGSFPLTRKRLLSAPNYQYIRRRSYRANVDADGKFESYGFRSKTIVNDVYRLQRVCKASALKTAEPSGSFRITLLGKDTPDLSFRPGQRITQIKNSQFGKINWDIVSVMYNFENGQTVLITEDQDFVKEQI